MAFKARLEHWKLSTTKDGVATCILDEVVAPATEHVATVAADDLPVSPENVTYALSVLGVTGSCVVEVAQAPTGSQANGRLITEGSQHWFVVKTGDKVAIAEYVAA